MMQLYAGLRNFPIDWLNRQHVHVRVSVTSTWSIVNGNERCDGTCHFAVHHTSLDVIDSAYVMTTQHAHPRTVICPRTYLRCMFRYVEHGNSSREMDVAGGKCLVSVSFSPSLFRINQQTVGCDNSSASSLPNEHRLSLSSARDFDRHRSSCQGTGESVKMFVYSLTYFSTSRSLCSSDCDRLRGQRFANQTQEAMPCNSSTLSGRGDGQMGSITRFVSRYISPLSAGALLINSKIFK